MITNFGLWNLTHLFFFERRIPRCTYASDSESEPSQTEPQGIIRDETTVSVRFPTLLRRPLLKVWRNP